MDDLAPREVASGKWSPRGLLCVAVISFPTPALVQGEDETLVLRIAEIMFPGRVEARPGNA